jgi:hypothetical protein
MFWPLGDCWRNIKQVWQLGFPFNHEGQNCYYAKESGA